MRKEAALIAVLGVLGWSAAPASADPDLLAQWTLDEGDRPGRRRHERPRQHRQAGRARRSRRRRSRLDPGPRRRQRAELRRLVLRDRARHRTCSSPGSIAVDAWVRRVGLARAVALRAVQGLAGVRPQRLRPLLGLRAAAWPSTSPARRSTRSRPRSRPRPCGTARWHHVIGSYDGERVRLWIDGSQVGAGTPTSMADRLHERQQGRSTSAPTAGRATSASAARSTTSPCGTTARPGRRPAR